MSMAKAIQYVGDAASAAQLLTTLQSTLASEIQEIAQAIAVSYTHLTLPTICSV